MKNGEDVFDELDGCGGSGCGPAAHDLVYGGGEQFCRCACKEVKNQTIILNYLTEIATWGKGVAHIGSNQIEAGHNQRLNLCLRVEQGSNPCYSKEMPKVTSKLQLTVPKVIADQYGIRPGDQLQWIAAGEVIHVIPAGRNNLKQQERTLEERLELFDRATQRQRRRGTKAGKAGSSAARGWKREELYDDSFAD